MKPTRTTWVYRADVRREFPDGVKAALSKKAQADVVVVNKKKKKKGGQ